MAIVASNGPAPIFAARAELHQACRIGAWLMLVFLSLASSSVAQQYQADPTDDKIKSQGAWAQNIAKNPATYSTDREKFLTFFSTYYFPAMTRFSSNDLAELGNSRFNLFSKYLWVTSSPELQKDVTDLAFAKMSPIVTSQNYHPAVRYNAILVIGQLDDKYAVEQGANRRPSTPYGKANELLLKIVNAAAAGRTVDPTLLVGALVGLERHAQFHDQLDRPTVDAMTASLLKLVQLEPLMPQTDRQVVQWIRLQAATVLAKLGSPGAKGEVNAALLKLVDDNTEPKLTLDVRCQIAAMLALLNYQGTTVDGKATADALLKLATEVAKEEATEAKNFEQLHLGGYSEGPRPKLRIKLAQYGTQPEYDRRTLLARFGDVRRALEATRAAVPADEQAKYDAVLAALRPAIDAAANKDEVDLQLAQKIGVASAEVQQAINPSAAPATPIEDADVF